MRLALDASVAIAWAFQHESQPLAARALQLVQTGDALAPVLFWYEVRNVLLVSERRRRLSAADVGRFLNDLAQLSLTLENIGKESAIFILARRNHLTFYGAAYLELALRERLPLATLDQDLARAARREHVAIIRAER